jgi:hypothetical protein
VTPQFLRSAVRLARALYHASCDAYGVPSVPFVSLPAAAQNAWITRAKAALEAAQIEHDVTRLREAVRRVPAVTPSEPYGVDPRD